MNPAFSGPAAGLSGERGGDLAGAALSAASGKTVSSPSGRLSCTARRTKRPAITGHGKGPVRQMNFDSISAKFAPSFRV